MRDPRDKEVFRGAAEYAAFIFVALLLVITWLSGCSHTPKTDLARYHKPATQMLPPINKWVMGFAPHCDLDNIIDEDEMFEYFICHIYTHRPLRAVNCLHESSEPLNNESGLWHFILKCGRTRGDKDEIENPNVLNSPGGPDDTGLWRH